MTEEDEEYYENWYDNAISDVGIRKYKNGKYWLMTSREDEKTFFNYTGLTELQVLEILIEFMRKEEDEETNV